MTAVEDDLSWFHQLLTPDEQAKLLSYPSQALPQTLAERLVSRPGITSTFWVASSDPANWRLEPTAARKLTDIRHQLDQWWDTLTSEQQAHITAHRNDPLGAEYAHIVERASGTPPGQLVVCLVRDATDGYSFRLPPMIRTYVDMLAR